FPMEQEQLYHSSVWDELRTRINTTTPSYRILPIDFVRGVVMVLMALDHASLFWNIGHDAGEGLQGYRPIFTDLFQFMTRFITHYCAPTFIFLAGAGIALSEIKQKEKGLTQQEITFHFIIRGVILLSLAWTLIVWIFQADPLYFGVLACIGVGFIVFAFGRRIPVNAILVLSTCFILLSAFIWLPISGYLNILFQSPEWPYGMYPLKPWLGVMGLGYVFGHYLQGENNRDSLNRVATHLTLLGAGLIIFFFILRGTSFLKVTLIPNTGTGWPANYLPAESLAVEHFFLISKYPPSIVFLLWTLGGMFIVLGLAFYLQSHHWFKKWTKPFVILGTTPLYFYCAHLYLYGTIPLLLGQALFPLPITLLVWVVGLVTLFPSCVLYREIKNTHPNSWLRYF
ncbi:MAG: DUF1624 domain-containing protein, partial [Candidatus Hodarchaeota archaeon]